MKPKKLYDFIAKERKIRMQGEKELKKAEIQLIDNLRTANQFKGTEDDVSAYERELYLISRIGHYKPREAVEAADFVFRKLVENRIDQTDTIKARKFEFAMLTGGFDRANALLHSLTEPTNFN